MDRILSGERFYRLVVEFNELMDMKILRIGAKNDGQTIEVAVIYRSLHLDTWKSVFRNRTAL